MNSEHWKGWLIAVFAVVGSFFIGAITGGIVASQLGFWNEPAAGFVAAFTVVCVSYVASPIARIQSSIITLVVGALIASWLLRDGSWYPENYGALAYQQTYLPLWTTYAGGCIGLVVVFFVHRFSKSSTTQHG